MKELKELKVTIVIEYQENGKKQEDFSFSMLSGKCMADLNEKDVKAIITFGLVLAAQDKKFIGKTCLRCDSIKSFEEQIKC